MSKFDDISQKMAGLIIKNYSTSFYFASSLLSKKIRNDIFNIYGFVRFADEIVDTLHHFDKEFLLQKFENDFYDAINKGISLNPVLHSFVLTIKKYNIPVELVEAFLLSMKKDLSIKEYTNNIEINKYINGSAEVVGLMCLKVFCEYNDKLYQELEPFAIKLGAAFQKVNFLRDLKNDIEYLERKYFFNIDINNFNENAKNQIVNDIKNDFDSAKFGIKKLPNNSKLAVSIAYSYYFELLKKITKSSPDKIINQRIRISNIKKLLILFKVAIIHKF